MGTRSSGITKRAPAETSRIGRDYANSASKVLDLVYGRDSRGCDSRYSELGHSAGKGGTDGKNELECRVRGDRGSPTVGFRYERLRYARRRVNGIPLHFRTTRRADGDRGGGSDQCWCGDAISTRRLLVHAPPTIGCLRDRHNDEGIAGCEPVKGANPSQVHRTLADPTQQRNNAT